MGGFRLAVGGRKDWTNGLLSGERWDGPRGTISFVPKKVRKLRVRTANVRDSELLHEVVSPPPSGSPPWLAALPPWDRFR